MWFRRKAGTYGIPAFMKGRIAQPDDEFVQRCGLPDHPVARRIAVGTRRIIAKLGEVEPQWVRHDDRFDQELGYLNFWESIDAVEFVMEVEDTFGMTIPDDDYDQIHVRGANVKDMVHDLFRLLKPKLPEDPNN